MTWEKAAQIATVVYVILFFTSVILIWIQLRRQTRLAKMAISQTMATLALQFNMDLAKDEKLAELWINGHTHFKTYGAIDRERRNGLLRWWLIFYENIDYQYRHGLLEKELHSGWDMVLLDFIKEQHLEEYWTQMEEVYLKEFRTHIDELMKKRIENSKDVVTSPYL